MRNRTCKAGSRTAKPALSAADGTDAELLPDILPEVSPELRL